MYTLLVDNKRDSSNYLFIFSHGISVTSEKTLSHHCVSFSSGIKTLDLSLVVDASNPSPSNHGTIAVSMLLPPQDLLPLDPSPPPAPPVVASKSDHHHSDPDATAPI